MVSKRLFVKVPKHAQTQRHYPSSLKWSVCDLKVIRLLRLADTPTHIDLVNHSVGEYELPLRVVLSWFLTFYQFFAWELVDHARLCVLGDSAFAFHKNTQPLMKWSRKLTYECFY